MSLLTPDFGLLFWMLVSFLIVFGVLGKFAFPVITRMVRERREHIEKSLEAADEANRRLADIRLEADRILTEAQARQAQIISKAVTESEQIVENARHRATAEGEKQMEAARKRIEIMQQKALGEVNSQVAMLSVDIAEKLLRRELGDRSNQEEFILKMMDEAENTRRKRSHIKE